ncbi:hypothetical protein D0864_16364 [Hortaea werneckii]|uniref:CHCH domain-containing protein n=2 Tax=Hortaea werneckii TaxID=91943 RepID=A0A3M7BIB7_HORWE|nr:hypothetical protein D0864_16364 [Hortaea werneckii]
MSTMGSPGGRQVVSKPSPPERGSFPLDHDAECQPIMKQYLRCLRSHRGVNDDECRTLSQSYLKCRMDRNSVNSITVGEVVAVGLIAKGCGFRNLMAPDSMRNLGFQEKDPQATSTSNTEQSRGDESTNR